VKILITGGAGFIGSQLGRRLSMLGHEVTLVDNLSFGYLDNLVVDGVVPRNFVCRDIRDGELANEMAGKEIVFHFAGISSLPVCEQNPAAAYDINVVGTANVLDLARRAGVGRVVFSSTSAVYENNQADKFCEADPVSPDLTYASTKAVGESICRSYAKNYGLDVVVARFFNVYGAHQDIRRVSPPFTSYVARQMVLNQPLVLFNKSEATRDYVYSEDLLDALTHMAFSANVYRGEVFNLCSGKGYSVPDLLKLMTEITSFRGEITWSDPNTFWDKYPDLFTGEYRFDRSRIAKEVHKSAIGDPTKTLAEFGWKAETPIEKGLDAVIEYARRLVPA